MLVLLSILFAMQAEIYYRYDARQHDFSRFVFFARDKDTPSFINFLNSIPINGTVKLSLEYNFNDKESYNFFQAIKDFCTKNKITFKENMNPDLQPGQIAIEIAQDNYEYVDINGDIGGNVTEAIEKMAANPQDLVKGQETTSIPAQATTKQVEKYMEGVRGQGSKDSKNSTNGTPNVQNALASVLGAGGSLN